jgi:hypothetical protein
MQDFENIKGKAIERDEEAIGQWVKRTWPAIKKKRIG